MQQNERYKQAKIITILGGMMNVFLGLIKLFGGIIYQSHALIADGIHSFSDLLTDLMVLIASKYGSQDADHSHPYGHQRIETATTLLLSLILILAGSGIIWDSCNEISLKTHDTPQWLSLPIAAFSILINEIMFHYTHRIGKRIQSDLIIANAWHHRSDAASSLVVLLGLIGSLMGFSYLDGLAAIIVGLMIIKMGLSYGWNSVKELVDSAVEPQLITKMEKIIQQVDGVQKIHQLRSRMMGPDIFIDLHIQVSPYVSVSEGHYIAQHVHNYLIKNLAPLKDVTVHVDPEDDEISCPSIHLPNRKILEQELLLTWREIYPALEKWLIHYLDGKIILDLICAQHFKHWQAFEEQIRTDLTAWPAITKVRLFSAQQEITLAN